MFKNLIPTGNSTTLLSEFENRYKFSRHDNLVYFITTDLKNVNSFDEKVKHKFGYSLASFERRWSSYCHHSISNMPFLTAVITIPDMKHYKLFYPDTEFDDLPTAQNEEKKVKKLYKDRRYKDGSSECIEISLNEVCDYFEKRQAEINEMSNEYNLDYNMWRIPFIDKDGNEHDRIEYFTKLDKENAEKEYKEKEEEKEKNKSLPLRKWGDKMILGTA